MVLGRFIHYAVDAVLASTVLAGVRRSTGYTVDTTQISDSTVRGILDKYFGVGETVFDVVQASAINSSYFKRSSAR